MTLKKRIIILFLISSLLPFIFVFFISYHTIYSILTNKIQDNLQSNLRQVELSLENAIGNLNSVSEQLAFKGSIGRDLEILLTSDNAYERSQMTTQINAELNLITFTNTNVGLTMYYFQKDGLHQFENTGVKPDFDPNALPLLTEYYGITYYGPHISYDRFNNNYVLSALRKVDLPSRDDVYVYIESNFKLTESLLDNGKNPQHAYYLFLDNNRKITYSEIPDEYPLDSAFTSESPDKSRGLNKEFYWFDETSNQGWSIVSVISNADYNKEMNKWFLQTLVSSMFFLGVSVFMAWLLWKMVYRPLSNFNKEIKLMTSNKTPSVLVQTRIPEFDQLLEQFRDMKTQIWDLFVEVQHKEKRRADLEVEKLLYQINPHFLMNTLDTVHWLAVMNGQGEIDRIITSLNKLLHYNLGKLGQSSTIRDEVDALKQYLILQKVRYDFEFQVDIEVDQSLLDMPIPRFILQPLVENSLYHGFSDNGIIQVRVKAQEMIEISIQDNGSGMTQEAIAKLLHSEQMEREKVGMGIGMNYVKRMLEVYYNGKARIHIASAPGQGTSIYLSLPLSKEDTP
ncbi:sensor histidine kinase [Paenibacillus glycinis]|uniref:histidine kinase n=1 Tax=Paenibacillus glycinis TaxID=2697035 RepID=A0ABW9XZ24_9BACL|nr:sensor histidine kinase [Paenibacillus glycinis]NBD27756.1 sensor histidine kinase [Paenibacillus glycinis]